MMLSGCSTSPSIIVESNNIDLPEITVNPSKYTETSCEPLIEYTSKDLRDIIKVTVKNNNLFYLCALKMESAILYIKLKVDLK